MSDLPPASVSTRQHRVLTPVAMAIAWIDAQVPCLHAESVALTAAAGRVLAEEVVSLVAVPHFVRAMMDGFAVHAADIAGATEQTPVMLQITGTVLPARPWPGTVSAGCAVRITTGAPLPAGADAVLPIEYTSNDAGQVMAKLALPVGKHVGRIGEDIAKGTTVLSEGRVLRPQDIGVLSSLGISTVQVLRRPRVRLVITGNELLPAGSLPTGTQIADANGPMLQALIERDGGLCHYPGVTPDDRAAIAAEMQADTEIVLVAGGSSVGVEDFAPQLLASAGELAIHGVALRPGSPTGMGRIGSRLVFLLPGNPVACLCAYDLFVGRAVRALGGRSPAWPYRSQHLPLASELTAIHGRVDYVRVVIDNGQVRPLALGGASLLSSTTRADGFLLLGPQGEEHLPGEVVEVFLYDYSTTYAS